MRKTQLLIAAIVVILILAVLSIVGVSLLGVQTGQSAIGLVQSTQAYHLAHAGLEWYMQQLAEDSDWTDQTNPSAQSLGSGTFEIELSNITANSIDITSTGKVTGADTRDRERWVSATVRKTFPGVRFAIFWQEDGPGLRLRLANGSGGTDISGDVWFVGSARIGSNSEVTNGWVYYGEGETISGSGTYTEQVAQSPFPDMPTLDTTYYDNLIANWNSRIDDADSNISAGSGNLTLSGDVDWTGQTISQRNINTNGYDITGTNFTVTCRNFNLENNSEIDSDSSDFTINCNRDFAMSGNAQINSSDYRINCSRHFTMSGTAAISSSDFELYLDDDFNTNGTVSVTGYGYIVCSNAGNVLLHNANSDSGTFTATPSGGSIYFLSGDSMTVNSSQNDTDVVLNDGCFLYSRNPSGNNDFIRIRNEDTTIDNATIIAERRIIVQNGTDITDSVLYVDRAGSNTNNVLQITGSSTTVSGSVISRGRTHPSLRINNGASVTGLLYQYDGLGTRGRTQINGGSTITGAVLVRQFNSNSLGPATITGDLVSLPSPLPNGFELFEVYVDTNSWDGL